MLDFRERVKRTQGCPMVANVMAQKHRAKAARCAATLRAGKLPRASKPKLARACWYHTTLARMYEEAARC